MLVLVQNQIQKQRKTRSSIHSINTATITTATMTRIATTRPDSFVAVVGHDDGYRDHYD